ncbi:S-adenosyl-L-methionine-dependent methyltransferase [Suillus ampliporus]|nr:S-adenosyl-L-methionine-dependent methyltransferase [Suillus ampliporus]
MLSELDVLQHCLNQALNSIRVELVNAELPPLTNYSAQAHPLDNPDFFTPPRIYDARRLAIACIGQLKALLQVPYEKVVEQSTAVYDTACLDIFVQSGIVDVLADKSCIESGLHIFELHQKLDLSAIRLATVLRYLASQGWVHEKSQDVFALNRSALELLPGRNGRIWSLTPGKPKVAASLLQFMTDPYWKYSTSPAETAFQLSHSTQDTLFAWLKARPKQLAQWASSVRSFGDVDETSLINNFPWQQLNTKLIIDCGGGQGCLTIAVARILPTCKFVIQDLPEVIPIARANVKHTFPEAYESGRITFEAHDFFIPQTYTAQDAVYIFRYVFHDWPEEDCVKILKNVRAVAGLQSKILIIDNVVVPATVGVQVVPNTEKLHLCNFYADGLDAPTKPPPFIPANYGVASKMSLALGIHMMGVFNAHERPLSEWKTIVSQAGLDIAQVHSVRANVSVIECVRRA